MNPSTTTLNLDFVMARRLLTPAVDHYSLVLVGCGGTGSWLAPTVARVARLLMEKFGKQVRVMFFDPDRVEPKNCYRQNFCEAEIGRNKAETLAFRYGTAWGVEIEAVPAAFTKDLFSEVGRQGYHDVMTILIGCVDNAVARRELARTASDSYRSTWWLDCGNHKAAGQVLIGRSEQGKPADPFLLDGFCSWAPLPSAQHPELLDDEPAPATPEDGLSCADLAMMDSQGLAINQMVAAVAGDYLVRLLLTKDLDRMATYVDLASGSMRSKYLTREGLQENGG